MLEMPLSKLKWKVWVGMPVAWFLYMAEGIARRELPRIVACALLALRSL